MSGHSKWASIKHKKGALDAKRGKIFTKLIREITVAAKEGGGKPDANPRLRLAIQKGKEANMPADNIERAIKKGTGELEGTVYESLSFEGYAPAGVAVIVEGLTDNRNRTTSEVRSIFSKRGGNLGSPGSVAFQFERKGIFLVPKDAGDEDTVMAAAIDAGAEDFEAQEEFYEITCPVQDFDKVRSGLAAKNIKTQSAELSMIPKNTMKVDDVETAKKVLALIEDLEDNDDVQNVYANFDISDEVLKKVEESK
ncbi:MAG: YebC/PmpR family DNA-binding transcriptional regulator [Candidatus Omnitrophica bacterium]|nr:YebC/PmpR family DNA-binding transcriptional regulator [Candidatus Omnitrophota bacterium]